MLVVYANTPISTHIVRRRLEGKDPFPYRDKMEDGIEFHYTFAYCEVCLHTYYVMERHGKAMFNGKVIDEDSCPVCEWTDKRRAKYGKEKK